MQTYRFNYIVQPLLSVIYWSYSVKCAQIFPVAYVSVVHSLGLNFIIICDAESIGNANIMGGICMSFFLLRFYVISAFIVRYYGYRLVRFICC